MKRYKILHVLYTGKLAGAETSVKLLVKNMDISKFENHVCFLHDGGIVADQMKTLGILVHVFGMKNGFDIISAIKFYAFLKKQKFDVIHYHTPNVLSLMMGRLYTRNILYHIRKCDKSTGIRRYFLRCLFRHILEYIAISDAVRESFVYNFPVKREKIDVLFNALELETFYSAKEDRALISQYVEDAQVVIGYAGRLTEGKGCHLLLDALSEVQRYSDNFYLFVLGEGPYLGYLKQYAQQLNLEQKVTFLPPQENIEQYYKLFDIFVVPSLKEAFGRVVIESMASGTPVIAFEAGGIPEIMRDKIEGFLIKPYDTEMMAKRILELMQNSHLRRAYGVAALKRAQLFSIHEHVKKIEEFYRKILTNP